MMPNELTARVEALLKSRRRRAKHHHRRRRVAEADRANHATQQRHRPGLFSGSSRLL